MDDRRDAQSPDDTGWHACAIVEVAVQALGGQGGRVLDLGCGNGVLLGKIRARVGDPLIPYGVDREPLHIHHARPDPVRSSLACRPGRGVLAPLGLRAPWRR
jgi:hypothetical protein